jgi:predicted transcriptional regulator
MMNVGMLWFDNDPRTALTAKVERAADYYRQKYGLVPDLCLVHPSMLAQPRSDLVEGFALIDLDGSALSKVGGPVLSEGEGKALKVAVRPNRAIMPGHLWIGKEEKN